MELKLVVKSDYDKEVLIDGKPVSEAHMVEIKIDTPNEDTNTIKIHRFDRKDDKLVMVDGKPVNIIDEYLVKGEIVFDTEVILKGE